MQDKNKKITVGDVVMICDTPTETNPAQYPLGRVLSIEGDTVYYVKQQSETPFDCVGETTKDLVLQMPHRVDWFVDNGIWHKRVTFEWYGGIPAVAMYDGKRMPATPISPGVEPDVWLVRYLSTPNNDLKVGHCLVHKGKRDMRRG